MDNGSETSKVGFAGDDAPRVLVPSVVGNPRTKCEKEFYVGGEAQSRRDVLDLSQPIQQGLIAHWDHVEKLWHHIFYNELKTSLEKHKVLLTEAPLNPQANREKTAEVLFEKFDLPALTLANHGVLSLFSTGRLTGVVIESGAGVTHTVPINQGYSVHNAVQSLDLAGRDLTEFLRKLLTERGHRFTTAADHEVVQDMKEKLCYLPLTFKTELMKEASTVEANYQLPDGKTITVGSERFRCPEALLQPSLIGKACPGLQTAVVDSVMKCLVDFRPDLWKNLVLAGGSTLFPGLSERLNKEITALAPSCGVKIIAPENRKFSVWLGGSILCGLPSEERWISRAEFQEFGPSIVTRKCP